MSPRNERIRRLMRQNAIERAVKRRDEDEVSRELFEHTGSRVVSDLVMRRDVPPEKELGEIPF